MICCGGGLGLPRLGLHPWDFVISHSGTKQVDFGWNRDCVLATPPQPGMSNSQSMGHIRLWTASNVTPEDIIK